MALILTDRVRETTTTTGTGNITLSGADNGFKTFDTVMSTNDTTYYAIVHTSANEFEVGRATYNGSNVLARTNVYSNSSNSIEKINFSSGNKFVFITLPAAKAAFEDASGNVSFANITVSGTVDGRDLATDGTKLDGIASNATAYANSNVDAHLNLSTANTGEVLSYNGSDYDWVASSAGDPAGTAVAMAIALG